MPNKGANRPGCAGSAALEHGGKLDRAERIEQLHPHPQLALNPLGQVGVEAVAAAQHDRLDLPAAELVLYRRDGQADFGQQRRQGRGLAPEPRRPQKDSFPVNHGRQIGFVIQQIDQKPQLVGRRRIVAGQQRRRFARAKQQPPQVQFGLRAHPFDVLDHRRSDGGGQHGAGAVGRLIDGHEIQPPLLVPLVELASRLEGDHVRQVGVRRGRQLELTQFDPRASDGHQGIATRNAANGQLFGDPLGDPLLGLIERRFPLIPRHRESMLDQYLAVSPGRQSDADFTAVPFQGE